jgi:hypothetical protein
MRIFELIFENKEWVFSGIGVFLVGIVWTLVQRKRSNSLRQDIKSGNNNVNIQVGNSTPKNIRINKKNE